jgi:hypothetical protein
VIALPHSYAGVAPEWLTAVLTSSLAGSSAPSTRSARARAASCTATRMHERDLLAHYLSELRAAKVDAPTCDEAWFDYRRFAI